MVKPTKVIEIPGHPNSVIIREPSSLSSTNDRWKIGCALVVFGLFAVLSIGHFVAYSASGDTAVITVEEKERVGRRDDSKYIVFTDQGPYECTDTLAFWKFNSSDVYGDLKPGHTYRVRTAGWRVPLFSWYKNIIEIEEEIGKSKQ